MTQSSLDETAAQQFMLFDLGSPETSAPEPALLPQLPDAPPARRNGKASKTPKAATAATTPAPAQSPQRPKRPPQANPATPRRLEIAPKPTLPEIPPLLLAGVRAALFQTLFQEALSGYQALLAQQPIEQRDQVVLAVEPARLGAAAQLLLDAPTLNAAVSLLALGAFLRPQPAQEHV
ncbi:MAG: hypothetical protein WCJ55_01600 [Chloroflexales bacterium]